MIRVNGTTYKWLGNDPAASNTSAKVTNIQISPTRSIFVMEAGPMNVTVTFLSPVEPDDWVKQSIPFSYVSVEAQSFDGNSYPVQMYSDISAEWESGDRSNPVVTWSNGSTANSMYHQIELQNPAAETEIANQAQDGTTYYAISTVSTIHIIYVPGSHHSITSQMDFQSVTRDQFQNNGFLTNIGSTAFTTISPTVPVFALAVDLGTISATDSPVTWSVGFVRDPSILYTTAAGATQKRRPYYVTQYSKIEDVIDAFTGDYAAALDRAVALDQKIMGNASNVRSAEYADIVALSTRQTMSALDITIGTDASGSVVAPSDIMIFMKNLGTDRRANPVERIYAAFPAFLYLNASLGGALLTPLLASQPDSLSDQTYAAQDIGGLYPQAQGPSRIPQEGVEQSGNMLIMMLAHARISGDGMLLSQNYNTAKRWADYLVSNALESQDQQNQDNGDASQLTNIALKGIIGVKAMAEIAQALGEDLDARQYGDNASALLDSFLPRATSSDGSRLLGKYGDQQSWSSMYNIFADKMLGLSFVPQSVIDMQTQFFASLLTSDEMGLPVDSDSQLIANAAWVSFTSAFVSDDTVRDALIKGVLNHANWNQSGGVFSERYNVSTGYPRNGFAGLPNKTISANSIGESGVPHTGISGPSRSSTPIGGIVGGVVGGLAVVGISVTVFLVFRKRSRRKRREEAEKFEVMEPIPTLDQPPTLTAYSENATVGSVRKSETPLCESLRGVLSDGTHEAATLPDSASQTSLGSRMWSSGRNSLSPTEVLGLRTEVENLRRVMQEFQAQRSEPPPEYAE
ncbi:hypothetical protein V8D89_000471 [Ganoderma adspersum]